MSSALKSCAASCAASCGALCVSLLLGACVSSGGSQGGREGGREAARDVLPGVAADAGAEFFSELDVSGYRIVKTYASASGRTCRRLADENGKVLSRVSCLRSDGTWTVGRQLGSDAGGRDEATRAAAAQVLVAPQKSLLVAATPPPRVADVQATDSVGEAVAVDDVPQDEVLWARVERDETLWSFAGRLTGDPQNWRRIASLNDIDDATTLATGRLLAVPVRLASKVREAAR